ncbi:transaldolase [Kutzneria sp. NPDC052558]|uniref:transaldolase n=1 Tax=Kutzneria sp. NPDC052558 TaxID=3364121 RepID=UPI0037C71B44
MTGIHDPLADLSAEGVSVWLDDLSRELLAGGRLASLIADRHVVGVTTNPTIFASALSRGERYDDQLRELAKLGVSADEAIFTITTDDVRAGCDALVDTYLRTGGKDGRVSIEVAPRLAHDTDATVEMARLLWRAVDRENLFVKIPATDEGLPAITEATAAGISVNVTLIFSVARYLAVVDAYLTGLERAHEAGISLGGIRSVASFFVSRVDTEIDARLDRTNDPRAQELRGRAAIANARVAYQAYEDLLASDRWRALAELGANPQRPLWASTGVKDPAYPDTMYVTELVAPDTVNTMPGATLEAFADHGRVLGDTIRPHYDEARHLLDLLTRYGIDVDKVADQLEQEGVAKFEQSWGQLEETVSAALHPA